jgi:hypothetical protein
MTTQLPPRERFDADTEQERDFPDVLFEEARRRRRRRWMAGSALISAAAIAGALLLGVTGGGGGGAGGRVHDQPSGSGAGAGTAHATASRLFPGAPRTQHYAVAEESCPLAPRNRYLPKWSGCVTATVADLSGDGHRDLILIYSWLGALSLNGFPPRHLGPNRTSKLYPAEQAMLRVVRPDGKTTTTAISGSAGHTDRPAVAALISVARVGNAPNKEIFLQTGQISSGSTAVAYGLNHGRLVSSGSLLAYGGDSATRGGFQCLPGNPPRLIQHNYELIRGIKVVHNAIFGWWNETTTTYGWHGPRLVNLAHSTVRRRVLPSDSVGVGCIKGIA